MRANWPQPASRIERFRPDLAATWVPGRSSVPRAERVMFGMRRSSSAMTSQVWTSARGLVAEVGPAVTDAAVYCGDFRPGAAAVGRPAFLAGQCLLLGGGLMGEPRTG